MSKKIFKFLGSHAVPIFSWGLLMTFLGEAGGAGDDKEGNTISEKFIELPELIQLGIIGVIGAVLAHFVGFRVGNDYQGGYLGNRFNRWYISRPLTFRKFVFAVIGVLAAFLAGWRIGPDLPRQEDAN